MIYKYYKKGKANYRTSLFNLLESGKTLEKYNGIIGIGFPNIWMSVLLTACTGFFSTCKFWTANSIS